jgi:hypothetical protein
VAALLYGACKAVACHGARSAGGAKDTGEYDPRSARAVDCGEIGLEERELQGSRLSSSRQSEQQQSEATAAQQRFAKVTFVNKL